MHEAATSTRSRRVLDRDDRIAEVLFGLIMALTFTGSLSIADSGRDDVRAMLVGALGCNLAWGLIDGVFYLFFRMAEHGEDAAMLRAVHAARDPAQAREAIIEAASPSLATVLDATELDHLHARLLQLPAPAGHGRLSPRDWLGALTVFLLVFLSTLPVALPFVFMEQVGPAMRASNAIAVAMLFFAGAAYARCIARPPWLIGLVMVALVRWWG